MKFADHLSKEQIMKFNQMRRSSNNKKEHKPIPQPKKETTYSHRELESLMGKHMDTYKRVNGALRRR